MRALLTAASFALLALPGIAIAGDKLQGEDKLAKLTEGRVAGKPVSCVPLSLLRESTIVDGKAIVYRAGARIYVNYPRIGADSLDEDQILVSKTSGSQLCSIDVVDLVDRSSGFHEGFVTLGEFVPYDRVKTGSR